VPSSAVIGRSRDTLQKAATGRNFPISDKENGYAVVTGGEIALRSCRRGLRKICLFSYVIERNLPSANL